MVLPRIYGYRGVYLVIIRILGGSVIGRWLGFFGCRIENPILNYDKYSFGYNSQVGLSWCPGAIAPLHS